MQSHVCEDGKEYAAMIDIPENHIFRIDIGIDYSMYKKNEIEVVEGLIELGDWQLNAICNNRVARIKELILELHSAEHISVNRRTEIEGEIGELWRRIEEAKREGVHRDYGLLKSLIFGGATADDVYPMMPDFYAQAYDLNRQIISRRYNRDGGNRGIGRKMIGLIGRALSLWGAINSAIEIASKFGGSFRSTKVTSSDITGRIETYAAKPIREVPHAPPPTPTN